MKTYAARPGQVLSLVFTATLLLTSPSAPAANRFWTGAGSGGNWGTASNWSNNIAPVAGDFLIFPSGVTKKLVTNDLAASTTFGGLRIDADYELRGNQIGLSNVVVIDSPGVIVDLTARLMTNVTFAISNASDLYWAGDLQLSGHDATFDVAGLPVEVAGVISGAGASSRLIKTGSGSLRLSGANIYEGLTSVNLGTLIVNGSIPVGRNTLVQSLATLAGTGSVGNVTNQGRLRPGDGGPGVLTINGSLTFSTSAIMFVDLDGPAVITEYDQVLVGGNVDLTTAADLNISRDPGFVPAIGTVFTILNKASPGALTGTFSGLPQGGTTNVNGVTYQISYIGGSGNEVTLTVTNLTPSLTVRTWDGGAANNNNWSAASNWDVLPVATNNLRFPRNAVDAICTNDFPADTVFTSLQFTGSANTNNYPLLRGNSIRLLSGIIATNLNSNPDNKGAVGIELPIKLAASQNFTNSSTNIVIELRSNVLVHPFILTFRGAGAFRATGNITATNTSTELQINDGHFIANGNVFGNISVNGAGQLSGTGSVGAVNIVNGLLSPGDGGTGILNIGGPLTLNASATVPVSLNSTNPGSGHDQLVVSNGNVSLGSAYLNLSVPSNITDVVGMNYTVIKVVAPSNSVSGEFAEMPDGLEVDAPPLRFRITYAGGDGNDVVLTIIGAVPSGRQLGSFNGALQGDAIVCTAGASFIAGCPNNNPPGFSFDQLRLFDAAASGGIGGAEISGNLLRLERGIVASNGQPTDISKFYISAPIALNRDQTVLDRLHWELTFADINLDGHALTLDTVNPGPGGIPGLVVTGLVSGATSSSRIIKTGTETVTLRPAAGVATYEGPTLVESNGLITVGNFASTIILEPSASLIATGAVGGILSTGGVVRMGILQSTGAVVLDSASQFVISLPPNPAFTNAQLIANAGVNLGNATLTLNYPFFPRGDTNYVIISKTSAGAVSGTFAGLPQNTDFLLLGHHYRISYTGGDGNDVIIISTNNPPVITQVSDRTIIEQIPFNLQITASDADPADRLTFSLDPGSPANAAINSTNGLLSWTPTEDQGPGMFTVNVRVADNGFPAKSNSMTFHVTVLDTNLPPTVSAPATVNSNELTEIRFNLSANDPDTPSANLIFSLLQSPPGMTFSNTSSTNILVSWTPAEDQGPSTNTVIVRVTEAGGGPSSTQTVSVVAREVNSRPVMQPIAGTNVLPGIFIQRELFASDDDIPANPLTFQLVSPPAGATLSNTFFRWTPASNQIGQFTIRIRCFDTNPPAVNATSLSTTQQFTVNVGVLRIVVNTNDSGPGSLRQAILEVNTNNAGGEIRFNITNATHKIAPISAFDTLLVPTVIDGYTQPGARPNQKTNGTDAILLVELSGENLPGGAGLFWRAAPVTIRGLCINRFTNGTALVSGQLNCSGCGVTSGSAVEGCFIGTDLSGTVALPNGTGIEYLQTHHSRIGGPDIAQRNLISGNVHSAISPSQGDDGKFVFNLTIQNNLIGCDRTGTNALGNDLGIAAPNGGVGGQGFDAHDCLIADNVFVANGHGFEGQGGLQFAGANNLFVRNKIGIGADGVTPLGNHGHGMDLAGNTNRVGTTNPSDANIIAFNNGAGVHIADGIGHAILGNSIVGNSGLGIDLGGTGRTDNDADDGDTGPNNLQNFPVLGSVNSFSGGMSVSGSLNSLSNNQYRLEFFFARDFSPANQPQAGSFLGATNVTTDSSGNATFSVAFPAPSTSGFITATATDEGGNTSEISDGIPLARLDIVSGAQLRVFWRTNLINFFLQANADLANKAGWTNVPGSPAISGSNFFHDVTPIDPVLFFRLKSQ